jgi:hypothetical protein
MHPGNLSRSEFIAVLGGLLLCAAVFLPWYETSEDNPNAMVAGMQGAVTAWQAHSIIRFLLLATSIAPLILAYIVMREHELSWPRGELTAVVAIAAFGFVAYLGFIDRPGDPPGEISLRYGWWMALAGVILMAIGGAMRAGSSERPRKPPGVL